MIHLFLADVDLKRAIVDGVLRRDQDVDFKLPQQASLDGKTDPEVLAFAADEGRVLVTHDVNTMPSHVEEFVRSRESPGVIITPQHMPVGQVIEALLLVIHAATAADLRNAIVLLPGFSTHRFSGELTRNPSKG